MGEDNLKSPVNGIITQSFSLEFLETPLSRYYVTNLPRNKEKVSAMTNLLQYLIQQEVIIQVPKHQEAHTGFLFTHLPSEETFWKALTDTKTKSIQ